MEDMDLKEIDLKEIGARIRKQRKSLGYNREQLAEKLEVSGRFCSSIELGKAGMSFKTLLKVSSVLSVSTDYILTGRTLTNDASPLNEMIKNCPPKKLKYAEEILKNFLLSCREDEE